MTMTKTKKPLKPVEDPPVASSSEEDELETSADEEEEEEVSSSEEEEPRDPIAGKSTTVSSAAATGDKQGSDSDSGSESETDSEGAPNPPISGTGKEIAVTTVKKKKEDPPSSATLALPAVKSAMKRPEPVSEGTTSRDVNASKRAKKVTSGEEEESITKPAFQRIWQEEDEIALLQGIIDFKDDTGKSLYEDRNGFYDFIKSSFSFEVSKNQLTDKIRSLKMKFLRKKVRNGVEPSFSIAHAQKSYDLSKLIWGPAGIAIETDGAESQSQTKKKVDSGKKDLLFGVDGEGDLRNSDWFDKSFFVQSISGFGVGEFFVKEKWGLVSVEDKKMVEEKLKLLHDKEIEVGLEKTRLLHEVMSMIAAVSSKKSKSTIAAESSKKSKSTIAAKSSKKSKYTIAAESSKKRKSLD